MFSLAPSGLHAAQWVITTNPLRRQKSQPQTLLSNLVSLKELLEATQDVVVAKTYRDYVAARKADKHVAFLAIQGATPLLGLELESF